MPTCSLRSSLGGSSSRRTADSGSSKFMAERSGNSTAGGGASAFFAFFDFAVCAEGDKGLGYRVCLNRLPGVQHSILNRIPCWGGLIP